MSRYDIETTGRVNQPGDRVLDRHLPRTRHARSGWLTVPTSMEVETMIVNKNDVTIKARQWYASVAADLCGRPEERDYVVGFADVNGETWCRISDGPGKPSNILTHPSMLRPIS